MAALSLSCTRPLSSLPVPASLPSIRKLFFEKSRRVKTQFCKVNGNSDGSPRFLFYTLRISRRYAVSANKTGAQSPCLPPEMELARQEMNYFYNSWLDLKGSIWKRDLCDRPLSTQAKTNIITILLIRNTPQEVDRLIKMLYWLIYIFTKSSK